MTEVTRVLRLFPVRRDAGAPSSVKSLNAHVVKHRLKRVLPPTRSPHGADIQGSVLREVGTAGSDAVNADVVSFSGTTFDAGDQSVGNAQLDLASGSVWAAVLTVRIQ